MQTSQPIVVISLQPLSLSCYHDSMSSAADEFCDVDRRIIPLIQTNDGA
jgi:hypothetical protein